MIDNLLLGSIVIILGIGLWLLAESSEWGERFVAILMLLGLAYCVGGLIKWVI